MKKLIVMAAMAVSTFAASAAYQVYEVTIKGKTTKYGGSVSTACGDTYNYRSTRSVTIKGILAGCGCAESIASGTCSRRVVAFWNETDKKPLVYEQGEGFTYRDGKNGEGSEQFTEMHFSDSNGWECVIFGAGLGAYKANSKDPELDLLKITSGFFGGYMTAPKSKIVCNACSTSGGETTQVLGICSCACDSIDDAEYTAFGGQYKIMPNTSKSKTCEKKGISAKTLGIPSYVSFEVGE